MMIDTDAADRTSGKNSTERKNDLRSLGILVLTSTASTRATASCRVTATTTKPMVLRNDTRIVGSAAISAKFSRPTNLGGVMMSHEKKARTTEARIGRKVNRPSPITVGARNSPMRSLRCMFMPPGLG